MAPKNAKPAPKKALITSMLNPSQQASGKMSSASISTCSNEPTSPFINRDASANGVVHVSNKSTDTAADGLAVMVPGSTDGLVAAINSMKEDFGKRFDSLLTAIQGVQSCHDVRTVTTRVTEAEERISANEDIVVSLQADNSAMKTAIDALQQKVDDLENRSRRSNLRLIGLPEGTEGSDMCAFLEKWLPEVLGAETFPVPLTIERAHRVGRITTTDTRPRAVIMKLLNFADKARIMKAARVKRDIRHENRRVMFFPDVSADLMKKRKIFDQVKKDLASLSLAIPELCYGIVHPATLLVTYNKKCYLFVTAAAAESFVWQLKGEQH